MSEFELTTSRLTAMRQVKDGKVEYDNRTATYWIDGVKAGGWRFRTLSELVRVHYVLRPRSGRGPLRLTAEGRRQLDARPPA